MTATPEFVDVRELAQILGVVRQTVYNWSQRGRIPSSRKVGNKRMFHLQSVLDCIERNGLAVDPNLLKSLKPPALRALEAEILREFMESMRNSVRSRKRKMPNDGRTQ